MDILGKLWNLPNDVLGLTYGTFGYFSGIAFGTDPSITFGNNAIQFEGSPYGNGGITLGNVQVYSNGVSPDMTIDSPYDGGPVTIGSHEEGHTYQSQVLGPLFLPVYFISGGVSGNNPFESSADAYGRGNPNPFSTFGGR